MAKSSNNKRLRNNKKELRHEQPFKYRCGCVFVHRVKFVR